jgi:hypothetical protein
LLRAGGGRLLSHRADRFSVLRIAVPVALECAAVHRAEKIH